MLRSLEDALARHSRCLQHERVSSCRRRAPNAPSVPQRPRADPVDVDGRIRVTQAGSRDRRSARVATAATHCGQPHRRRPVIDRVLELHRIQGAEFPSSRPKHTRHRLKVLHSARLPDLLLISHRCDGAAVNRGRAARQRDTVRVRGSLSLFLASSAPVLEISKWCGSEDLLP